jgi:LysR family transcriptional activator of nhaA
MNFNHLHYFHVIASEGTLARAAKKLGISQPTLSGQLKQLEDYFSAKLFDRSSGSLRLNANGRKALEVTTEMFRLGEKLDGLFPGGRPRIITRLEIGISTTVSRSFAMHRFIKLFANRDILTRVRQGDHEYLYHELLTSGLDLFITDNPPDSRRFKGTVHRKLSSPEFVVIAPNKLAKTLSEKFPLSLNRQPFIHYTAQSAYRFEVDQYFRQVGVEPQLIAEADDVYLIRDAVEAGIGIGIVPRHLLGESPKKSFTVLGSVERPFEIHAVYIRQNPTEQVLSALEMLSDPLR